MACKILQQGFTAGPGLIELQTNGAGRVQSGFQDARLIGHGGLEGTGVTGVPHPFHPSDNMAEALTDLRPGLQGLASDVRRREQGWVIVEA